MFPIFPATIDMMPRVNLVLLSLLSLSLATAAPHVVLFGVDGLGSADFRGAQMPRLDRLRCEGSSTVRARGVIPTVSSPNWASMIMGAAPEQHGVTSNDWQPDRFDIAPLATGRGGIFPTIFGVLREQRPFARIGIFTEWPDFGRLVERGVADALWTPTIPKPRASGYAAAGETTAAAIAFLREHKPDLTFIQLDLVDRAGHRFGHGSPECQAAEAEADRLLGLVIDTLRETGLASETWLLVTADHGGVGKKHGGMTTAEIEIPWILTGPGVATGHEIRAAVNTYDTAPTVARILGLKAPECWIGRVVDEVFAPRH